MTPSIRKAPTSKVHPLTSTAHFEGKIPFGSNPGSVDILMTTKQQIWASLPMHRQRVHTILLLNSDWRSLGPNHGYSPPSVQHEAPETPHLHQHLGRLSKLFETAPETPYTPCAYDCMPPTRTPSNTHAHMHIAWNPRGAHVMLTLPNPHALPPLPLSGRAPERGGAVFRNGRRGHGWCAPLMLMLMLMRQPLLRPAPLLESAASHRDSRPSSSRVAPSKRDRSTITASSMSDFLQDPSDPS